MDFIKTDIGWYTPVFGEFYQTIQCVGNGFHRPIRDISIAGCSEGGTVRIMELVHGAYSFSCINLV